MKATKIAKGTAVRILTPGHDFNKKALVTLVSRTGPTQVKLEDGSVRSFSSEGLIAELDVTSAIIEVATQRQLNWKAEEEAWKLEQARREQDKYIAKRREHVVPTFSRETKSRSENYIEYGKPYDDGTVNSYATINHAKFGLSGKMPNVTVNWAAIGSVAPEDAIAFATMLLAAAQEALAIRAEQEAALGITI